MPGLPIFVGVQGAQQFRQLSRDLKKAGRGDLQKALRRNIKTAAKPVEADLRTAVLAVKVTVQDPPGGGKGLKRSTGLRARTAKAITTSITQRGIRIKVSERKFGDYGATLPRYLDSELRGYDRWRHPVFDDPDIPWVQQKGQPWFFTTIHKHRAGFRRAIFQAMDDIAKQITR